MEWTVHELAERAGISGRTLRHYHRIGLLEPDRVGSNGYRYYGPDAVARLQRILLLRDTGMPLAGIASVLAAHESPTAEIDALEAHLGQLAREREALERRITAVEHTLEMRRRGREPRMDVMLDGFNDRYETEVVQRWGREAFEASNQWWHGKSVHQQQAWKADAEALLARWRELHEDGHAPDSAVAQQHAVVHLAWFADIPGTPTHAGDAARSADMVRGMADLYESSPDFHRIFGTREAARFAANALRLHVERLSR
ncbi:MerR family transcriptional regulator [Streptomyces sp. BE147]|uniref:MerR family transcriptional regulator n=1 Tax=Streptomyces sp. BE147 TaxID=3002524 RepID=UPI002E7A403F|nr:MerR family transcriptional regulator [Streptomyces sp. BE147]MEE1737614.1 MerR family transcriptional regulator [Streptomyces sp. BE147]